MEHISMPYLPGALTDCAARVLQCISRAGVWIVAPKDLNAEQLRAILFLRNTGYIEYAAHVGYKIRTNAYTVPGTLQPPPADAVVAIERISVCRAKNSVMVVMKDGRAHNFKAARWEYLAGLVALAETFGSPQDWRMMSGVKVYVNRQVKAA